MSIVLRHATVKPGIHANDVNKDWTHKVQDKDKDFKLVLEESLRTRPIIKHD
jgi:hypothetical protein